MKKIVMGLILICLSASGFAQTLIASRNGYSLTRDNVINLIQLSRTLADNNLSNDELWEIYYWSIADFNSNPEAASRAHQSLKTMYDGINNAQTDFEYLLAIQNVYYELENKWRIENIGGRQSFLNIVKRYNPIFVMDKKRKFFLQYNGSYVAKKNGYYLSQLMIDAITDIAEFMARDKLSNADKNDLKRWAIRDFQDAPKGSTAVYAQLINETLPTIHFGNQLPHQMEELRENIYTWFHFYVVKNIYPTGLNYNLMDIVQDYNPILIEDEKNKVLMARSTLLLGLSFYKLLEDIIGVPVPVTPAVAAYERNFYVKEFRERPNRKKFNSLTSQSLIKARELLFGLKAQEKNRLIRRMKTIYLNSRPGARAAEEAFQPLFAKLHKIELERLLANQYLFTNQILVQNFNNVYAHHFNVLNGIVDSFKDFNTRLNLSIVGGNILSESNNYFQVQYNNRPGEYYYVYK